MSERPDYRQWDALQGLSAAIKEHGMKPKTNRAADPHESQPFDRCETPAYALDPLLPFLPPPVSFIWEPACGSGRIAKVLRDRRHWVWATDILHGTEFNFFTWEPPKQWSMIVTNPPYSCKPEWIERCYSLGRPFALLVPVETIGTGRVQRLMERHGAELLLLDKRVNFYMPHKGLEGGGAQFPVLWFCWRLLPTPIVYGRITRRPDEQPALLEV